MKTEEIKVRIEPLSKSALVQIAKDEGIDLSDIVRRALTQMISRYHDPESPERQLSKSRYAR